MDQSNEWRHSETRAISPFKTSPGCLDHVGFRTSKEAEFDKSDPWVATTETESFGSPDFAPEFDLDIDPDALREEADVDPSAFRVSVLMRDPSVWSSRVLAEWPLAETPRAFEVPREVQQRIAGQRGLTFSVVVSPKEDLERRFRRASRRGQIVAQRNFVLSPPVDGVGFPIQVVPAETFTARGLPGDAVWYIEWMDWLDFDRAPEDVLCIFMNEDVSTKLLQLAGNDALGNVLWRSIASEAVFEMCLRVFGSDPKPPEDPNSLLARLIGTMRNSVDASLDDLVLRAKSVEGSRYFRTVIQSSMELGKKSKALNMGGRRS